MMRTQLAVVGLLAAAVLAGCAPTRIAGPGRLPEVDRPAGPVPSYREIAERYNANLSGLDRLWATSVTSLRWVDEEGDRQFEQGEGNFIFVQPRNVALTIGKLGEPKLWGGSSETHYWLFELLGDPETAWIGRHRYIGRPCARELPIPVNPTRVPYLLGLLPLEQEIDDPPEVEVYRGYYVLYYRQDQLRMVLDPETYRPVRVDLTNEAGESVVISRLYDPEGVDMLGIPAAAGPKVASRAEIFVPGEEAQMKLFLSNLTDGREEGKINEAAFNLDRLIRAYEPERLILLDEACE
ncbi:MAG: hypothetical protein ACOCTI_06900 [Phycisphaeraceae bacterium]